MAKTSTEKKEIEETLNQLFGVNIRWSRLSKADLERLINALTGEDRCKLCERLDCAKERYPILEIAIKSVGKINKQGPLVRMLSELLGVEQE